MRIIKPYTEIMYMPDGIEILKMIERAGRTCYKSEDKITDESCKTFVAGIIKRGHEAMVEFADATVKFICDRGVSHEIVRHRIASYAQESTRYVGYADKLISNGQMSEEDVVEKYELGLSMKKISELSLGKYKEWDVYKILDKNNIERRNFGSKGIIHEDFFTIIDMPEKAYLMGFIQADGSLHNDTFQVSITQKDGWFIERMLKDFIKPSTIGSKDGPCKQYSFSNEKLYNALLQKGLIPNKSYKMEEKHAILLWESISEKLKPDFLRGLLDGDGSLRFFKQKNEGETDSCNITWNGDKNLLSIISLWFSQKFNYKMNVLKVGGTEHLHRISITQPEVGLNFCKEMYRNFVFPYGHPIKTSRVFEKLNFDFKIATWGHEKFNVILPFFFVLKPELWEWAESMEKSEQHYTKMMEFGALPQEARSVLPNSIKTEIVIKANMREWRQFFRLRTAKAAHPQMRELTIPLLKEFKSRIPVLFDDIITEG